jgi:hypothetical protein
MYFLYLDESGGFEHTNFILGGTAIFEGEIRRHNQNIDAIMEKYFPGRAQEIELHVTELRKIAWNNSIPSFTKEHYYQLLDDISRLIADERSRQGLLLFASVIHKPSLYKGTDPYVAAFEGVVQKFDTFLVTQHKAGHTNKGIVILSRCSPERSDQMRNVYYEFRTEGTRWGKLYNLPEIPLFAESESTRLLQLADFVAHIVFQRYENHYTKYFEKILGCFHQDNNVIHGIGHLISKKEGCMCEACISRK